MRDEAGFPYRFFISGETKEGIYVVPFDPTEREPTPDFSLVNEILEETELQRLERRLRLRNLLAAMNFLHRAVSDSNKTLKSN